MTRHVACGLGLLFAWASASAAPPDVRGFEQAVQRAAAKAEPAVASIIVSRRGDAWQLLASPDHVPEFFGSGVVIDHRLVLTCYHVVRDATTILVRLPALDESRGPRLGEARIYAADNRTDLAVLRVERDAFDTPAVELGRGEDLKKGRFIVALTNPFQAGFRETGATVTPGTVSNLRRRTTGNVADPSRLLTAYGHVVQTDARIPPGGSGGALVDLDGRLVGVVTALAALAGSETQGGYAIAADDGVRRVIEVLRKGEEVEYGFLGVASAPERFGPYRRSAEAGVTADTVTPNSPAARAGLRPGDTILRVNGRPVADFNDMYHHINMGLAGRDTTLLVQRTGVREPMTLTARLAKAYVQDFGEATNRPAAVHGLRVDYASVIQRSAEAAFGNQPMPDGVVVREAIKDSPAEAAKLAEYSDVITAVNGVRVNTPAEFTREADKAVRESRPVRLTLANPPRTVILP